MRITVTGATGFLGGRLARRLAIAGAEVTGWGRDRQKGAMLQAQGIRFQMVDLEASGRPEALPQADVFVHAAALSSAWGPAARFHAANVAGTERALDLARRMGARRFIFLSSPSVSFSLEDRFGVKESDPLPPPINAYAWSKALAEARVRQAMDLKPIILRPRAIYGRGDVALLPRLVRAAESGALPLMRGGRALTQLTHVDDVVEAVCAAIAAPAELAGGTYHVTGPEVLPVRAIAEAACLHAGIEARWRAVPWPLARTAVRLLEEIARRRKGAPEPRITLYGLGLFAFTQVLETGAIRRDLGFEARIPFAAGLEEAFSGGEP